MLKFRQCYVLTWSIFAGLVTLYHICGTFGKRKAWEIGICYKLHNWQIFSLAMGLSRSHKIHMIVDSAYI